MLYWFDDPDGFNPFDSCHTKKEEPKTNGQSYDILKFAYMQMSEDERAEARALHPDGMLPLFAYETPGKVPPDELIEHVVNYCGAKGKIWATQHTDDYGVITGVAFYDESYPLLDVVNDRLTANREHTLWVALPGRIFWERR